MSMTYATERLLAQERMVHLQREAQHQEAAGRPIKARDCRVSAMVLGILWEVPT